MLLASGRTADVFSVDERTVLRRYRQPTDISSEVAVMRHVHAHGFPVPALYDADLAAGSMTLERLAGPTMAEALIAGEISLVDAAGVLAMLLRELHRLPTVSSTTPGATVVHLDLHPENVLLADRGPVLIDWCNARDGVAVDDVAMSALIIAEVAVGSTPLAAMARGLLRCLLHETGRIDGYALSTVVAKRRADPNVTDDERARLRTAAHLVTGAGSGASDDAAVIHGT